MGAVFSVAMVSWELTFFADLWGTGEIVDILLGRGDDGSNGLDCRMEERLFYIDLLLPHCSFAMLLCAHACVMPELEVTRQPGLPLSGSRIST